MECRAATTTVLQVGACELETDAKKQNNTACVPNSCKEIDGDIIYFPVVLRMSTTIGLTFFCNPHHYGSPHTHYRITNLSLYSDFLFSL